MEKQTDFTITGAAYYITAEQMQHFALPSQWFIEEITPALVQKDPSAGQIARKGKPLYVVDLEKNKGIFTLSGERWYQFVDANGTRNGDGGFFGPPVTIFNTADSKMGFHFARSPHSVNFYNEDEGTLSMTFPAWSNMPLWGCHDVVTYDFHARAGFIKIFLGKMGGQMENMSENPHLINEIPAANWAVFTFTNPMTPENVSQAYARILTEWFPTSGYKRNESVPHMEKFSPEFDTCSQKPT
jgi:hypothetical protein